ncbi:Serine/threonine-protein kinase tel1 [Coemansia sp. RSA 2703]|nr:Serine/threonine-protein kinase tel1 [Coemansia sp. RSA 2703]
MEQRRSEAATQILVGVTTNSPDLKAIVQAIDNLINAYLDLAVSPVPEKFKNGSPGGKLIAFGSRLRISNLIKNLPSNIPVLTAVPRIEAPRDYMCVPFISTVSEGYSLAGGINLPKIVRVLGTDGKRYKQLVKGKDDMRQDAIIQQLFGVINRFVRPASNRAQGPAASSPMSGLQIRTYQVVPLAKRCGVLQWVENTTPFGTWFREKESKYRPNSPGTSQLRAMVHAVHTNKTCTLQERLDIFERVTSLAPPIFRFFFYENFYHAQSWFEHREAYIRSAAVASIAGWVLGIGDRHLQNILIDKTTAELVHIDLGIAFDLGKLLPIPELVPFRLTREMIDGMGLLGLNSTFRHVCEEALEAMRQNSRVISTILNVLKVDPLYMWSLIPLRIHKMNRNASMYTGEMHDGNSVAYDDEDEAATGVALEENKEAGRSILHVSQRLNASISAEGQVSELIQQATDPDLLSRMFEGWSAWY